MSETTEQATVEATSLGEYKDFILVDNESDESAGPLYLRVIQENYGVAVYLFRSAPPELKVGSPVDPGTAAAQVFIDFFAGKTQVQIWDEGRSPHNDARHSFPLMPIKKDDDWDEYN